MISIRRSRDRGFASHGWLETYHTFSFANYHDPEFTGFSVLRVINQDRVAPGKGFHTHGHENMEIVSYVLSGSLEHRDSAGNSSTIRPGDVQLMSAGTGIRHSELNPSRSEPVEFLQMWVLPANTDTPPRYEQESFSEADLRGRVRLVVSPDGREGSLTIGQDARMYAGRLGPGDSANVELERGRCAWVHVARGQLTLNGNELGPGDGAGVLKNRTLTLEGVADAEVIVLDLP